MFNFDEYGINYCMHCATEEEANEFCKLMDESGRTWNNGTTYLERNHFDTYKDQTVYYFNQGMYCSFRFAVEENDTILRWSDFGKNNMVVELL